MRPLRGLTGKVPGLVAQTGSAHLRLVIGVHLRRGPARIRSSLSDDRGQLVVVLDEPAPLDQERGQQETVNNVHHGLERLVGGLKNWVVRRPISAPYVTDSPM